MPHHQASKAKVRVPPKDGPAAMFHKTRLCSFYQAGKCQRGKSCLYAHGDQELAQLPDFSFTSLCPVLLETGRCNKVDCKFAHSHMELRHWKGGAKLTKSNMIGSSGPLQCNTIAVQKLQEMTELVMTQMDSLQKKLAQLSMSHDDDDDDDGINTSCCMGSMGQNAWSRMSTEDVTESDDTFSRQSTGNDTWFSEDFDEEHGSSGQQDGDNLGNLTLAAFNVGVKNTFLSVDEPAQILRRVSSTPAMF